MFLKKQNTFKSSSFPIDPVSAANAEKSELSIADVIETASGRVRTQLYPSSVRVSYSEQYLLSQTAILSNEDIYHPFDIGSFANIFNVHEYCLTHPYNASLYVQFTAVNLWQYDNIYYNFCQRVH